MISPLRTFLPTKRRNSSTTLVGHLEARVTGDLKIEFPQVETRISDLVMKAESQQGPVAVHLEFQSRNDDDMPYRMLRYALEIYKTYHLPVYQLVIYFGQWPMNMTSRLDYRLSNQNLLDYRYYLIGKQPPPAIAFLATCSRQGKAPEKW